MGEIAQEFFQYGLLGLVLFFMGWGLLLGSKWLAGKVDILIDILKQFIDKTDQRLGSMEDIQAATIIRLDNIEKVSKDQAHISERTLNILDRIERNTANGKPQEFHN